MRVWAKVLDVMSEGSVGKFLDVQDAIPVVCWACAVETHLPLVRRKKI